MYARFCKKFVCPISEWKSSFWAFLREKESEMGHAEGGLEEGFGELGGERGELGGILGMVLGMCVLAKGGGNGWFGDGYWGGGSGVMFICFSAPLCPALIALFVFAAPVLLLLISSCLSRQPCSSRYYPYGQARGIFPEGLGQ